MRFMRKLKDVMPERTLRYLLHEHLAGPEPHRGVKVVHASELTREDGFCPRMYALGDVSEAPLAESWVTTSERVTYWIGHALQAAVVDWFADMGRAVGHWRCLSCRHRHVFQKRPYACESCGARAFRPEEVRFVSAETGVSCGVDLLLSLGETRLTPVEIKTIDKDRFKELKGPLAEHRQRTALYLRLIGESEQPWANLVASDRARVLYVSKGGYGCAAPEIVKWGLSDRFSPFKEYEVKRDDALTEEGVRRARVVQAFRAGEIGMPTGICATGLTRRAKACPLRKVCFSGHHPGEHDWQVALSEVDDD